VLQVLQPREKVAPLPPTSPTRATFTALWNLDPPSWTLRRLGEVMRDEPLLVHSGDEVVGVNETARRQGLRPGETVSRALQLLPKAKLHPHDPAAQTAAWEATLSTIYTVTPWVERISDHLLFAGGLTQEEARDLAQTLQLRVGMAPSRGTSQLAALICNESQVRFVKHEMSFIAQVPVRYLRGLEFSSDLIKKLLLFGIEFLSDLHRLRLTEKQLRAQFGKEGTRLFNLAHGNATEAVKPYAEPRIVKVSVSFEIPLLETYELQPQLERLTERAVKILGGLVCWTVTVTVISKQLERTRRRVLSKATRELKALLHVVAYTFDDAHVGGNEVDGIRLVLGQLEPPKAHQQKLFTTLQRPDVREALERVDRKYPGGIGVMNANPKGRFPEEEYFFTPLGPSQKDDVGEGRRLG
jgi:nucleotidyltransferase/DNA polymerase involved in DNA repair